MNKNKTIRLSIGILTGAVIGASVALLFARRTGKKTRKMVQDSAVAVVDAVKAKSGGVIGVFKDAAAEANHKGRAVIKALKR